LLLLAKSDADVLCRIGPDLRICYVSPVALRLLGRQPAELLGHSPNALIMPEDLPLFAAATARDRPGADKPKPTALRVHHPDGSTKWIEVVRRLLLDPTTGEAGDTILVMSDITERRGLEQRLANLPLAGGPADRHAFDDALLALTDGPSGLANRRAFDDALELEWWRAEQEGTPISVLLLALDGVEAYHDDLGQRTDSDSLRAAAGAVRAAGRRPSDVAGRYRADQLALILPNTHASGAATVAEHIRAAVSALRLPHTGNAAGRSHVTASLGAATAIPGLTGTIGVLSTLLMAAGAALDKAKSSGPNRVAAAVLLTLDANTGLPVGFRAADGKRSF
jgi:diguanylate cyclase (GGDEF)-like protein/PAS domain S-box-containing protein